MNKICIIFGAGNELPAETLLPENNRMIIAADGGFRTLNELGITPDRVIGDLDSLDKAPGSDNFTLLPHVKDTTDMYEAVQIGLSECCDEFRIYGGTGGRTDHTLANIQLAAMLAEKGKKVYIFGSYYVITAVKNGKIHLEARKNGYVSVFAHSDICRGVTIKGLYYETDGITLKNDFALGVSNEFIGREADISVEEGILCVYYETKEQI